MSSLRSRAGALAPRLLLFSLLWLALSGGTAGSWLVGVPSILAATAASMALRARHPGIRRRIPKAGAIARFAGFFLWQSLRGGLDVAWRAIHPRLPIAPGFVDCRLHVPAGLARVFVVDVISLLPGTLSVSLEDDRLRLHVIDTGVDAGRSLRRIERHAVALFGLEDPLLPPD
jgi:multicomponent Na+:H+ antiporter subunit E